ncbi:MAG: sigma-70 family RNA polymerase sigma factor [Planctomycetes bacterium]|nr:sigma-70 family RNA polymerase sigma factor [Planctomycetota bacterium]
MLGSPEELAFNAYKKYTSSVHLSQLLSLHQGRAYNLCFQVLCRREDAEDAAQDALLKIVEWLPRIESATAFRRRLYRICLTQALNLRRSNYRRQVHESRYAMTVESPRPEPEGHQKDERAMLFQALERIDDEERNLIVEHYFEGTPLTKIAAREGISNEAIWKRIDRARRSLKETLVTLGVGAFVPDPISLLEACHPVTLSTNLVPGVLEKLAPSQAVTTQASILAPRKWILTSGTKPMVLGGTLMAVKQSIWTPVAITVLFLLGLTLIGALLIRYRGASQEIAVPPSLHKESIEHTPSVPAPEAAHQKVEDVANAAEPFSQASTLPSATTALGALLEEYCRKLDRDFPERVAMKKRVRDGDLEAMRYMQRLDAWRGAEIWQMRESILSDPASLLLFLQSKPDGQYVDGILSEAGFATGGPHVKFDELPTVLADGLRIMLQSGSRDQRCEILEFSRFVIRRPDSFDNLCRSSMQDPDPEIQKSAIMFIRHVSEHYRRMTESELNTLREVAQQTLNPDVACSAIRATNSGVKTPETMNWLFEIGASPGNRERAQTALFCLIREYAYEIRTDPGTGERLWNALNQQIEMRMDNRAFATMMTDLLNYHSSIILPVVDKATTFAPDPLWANCAAAVATAIRSGTRNSDVLRALLPADWLHWVSQQTRH